MLSTSFKIWSSASVVILVAVLLIQQKRVYDLASLINVNWASRCENSAYEVRILSFDPLMIHLENFITPWERKTIIDYSIGRLEKSTIIHNNGTSSLSERRTSTTGLLPRNNSAAVCVVKRWMSFQGFRDNHELENIQVTHYEKGQQFKPHLDYRPNSTNINTNRFTRATTGFAILHADCESCGTQFPKIKTNWTRSSPEWCRIVECDEQVLTVKPLPGSILFWQNVRTDGEVDERMVHAGLPLDKGGSKTGLNLWTRLDLWQTHML